MTFEQWWAQREATRKQVRAYVATLADDVLIGALRYGESRLPVRDTGEIFERVHEADWEVIDALAGEVSRRYESRCDFPRDLLVRQWADELWCALRTGWEGHRGNVRAWLAARAELLVCYLDAAASGVEETSLAEIVSAVQTSPARRVYADDPLVGYDIVEGGYRWFYDGRPPEPVTVSRP